MTMLRVVGGHAQQIAGRHQEAASAPMRPRRYEDMTSQEALLAVMRERLGEDEYAQCALIAEMRRVGVSV
ncbi:hypothetical protein [Pseudomonas oryzihabitans]|uniref:hypothetical protein n=1 Tax=Pseudomonas oryzihabitans TaxID=47885 RepID=UPI00241E8B33|nr:hypothetical protein [Pseudomonas oryzihabitans]